MQLVRAALPPQVKFVGYLQGADLEGSTAFPDLAEYFLAQYGLAPVVLEKGHDYEWVLGNFGHSLRPHEIEPVLEKMLGRITTQDFGFGIYLIHRIPN